MPLLFMSYSFDELDGKHYTALQQIAEDLGIEYTTKAETIEAILAAQEPSLFTPEPEPEPVSEPEPVCPMPEPCKPSYWQRIGKPVGNDGQKIRYSLDGKRRLN